ncbi:LirA/MavJ family T4SS effector [Legionella worsleiensis]|uniref:DUF5636 domain-containing protein n=1 Tax=Legionella worsleiensis TaxID=45076 RepID=A0A0W1A5P3_9GAMM|nr:LirA/MavJ family T4SS effector [Legionella worsleiensis]KTD76669.1 hypothetical protein Lwor_1894 [Legionella worsleiensis]STY30410.1 Uncharacterised protein [Legionella worsleiensis]
MLDKLDRNVLKMELINVHSPEKIPVINKIFDIAEFFVLELEVDSNTIMDDLITLFPPLTKLTDVFLAPLGEKYIYLLMDFINTPGSIDIMKNLINHFQSKEKNTLLFKSINTLLELKVAGISIEDDYLYDFLTISNKLSDNEFFTKGMDHLETELQKYALNNPLFNLETHRERFFLPKPKTEKPYDRQKILSSFLYQWAQANGFNKKGTIKIDDFLSADTFLDLLKNKIIFKDSGAESSHGPWPHALQWFVLIEENKKTPLFKHSPMEIYEHIGTNKYLSCNETRFFDITQEYGPSPLNEKPTAAWDIFFDRLIWNRRSDDYRKPETVTRLLLRDADKDTENKRWPLLSECVFRSFKKSHSKGKSLSL